VDHGEEVPGSLTNTAIGAEQIVQARDIIGDVHVSGSDRNALGTAGMVRLATNRGAAIAGFVLGVLTAVGAMIGMTTLRSPANKQPGSPHPTSPSPHPPAPTPGPTGDRNQQNEKVAAKVACDRAVDKRLKAPATAKYADYTDAKVTYRSANKTFTVTTYVDSQNGFSATLRLHYVCKVTHQGETWKVIDLDTKEQSL
jgi:hypothetical protein